MEKAKWTVFANMIGGKRYYIVGRRIDASKPSDFMNVELRGRYMADKEACRKEADRLNASALVEKRWIPVGEQLPELGEMVAVTCVTKKGVRNWNRAFVDINGFWHGSGSMAGVVAWMPMEAYEG